MTDKKLREIVSSLKWKKTSTFKTYAHEYTLEKRWENRRLFQECYDFINKNGEARVFYRRVYRYYTIDEYDYWAMSINDGSGIINRTLNRSTDKVIK